MVSRIFSFCISDDCEELEAFLRKKLNERQLSKWILEAMQEKYKRDTVTKMDKYFIRTSQFETLPPVWDQWRWDDFKDHRPDDLQRLLATMNYNVSRLRLYLNDLAKYR